MKPKPPDLAPPDPGDARAVDAFYGLEPVIEPAADARGSDDGRTRFETIECPFCGEPFEALLDLSSGSAVYIEDCQICCRPIQFQLEVDDLGRFRQLTLGRAD